MSLNTIVSLLNFDLILLALSCCKCFECIFGCYGHVSTAIFSCVQLLAFVIFISANTFFLLSDSLRRFLSLFL